MLAQVSAQCKWAAKNSLMVATFATEARTAAALWAHIREQGRYNAWSTARKFLLTPTLKCGSQYTPLSPVYCPPQRVVAICTRQWLYHDNASRSCYPYTSHAPSAQNSYNYYSTVNQALPQQCLQEGHGNDDLSPQPPREPQNSAHSTVVDDTDADMLYGPAGVAERATSYKAAIAQRPQFVHGFYPASCYPPPTAGAPADPKQSQFLQAEGQASQQRAAPPPYPPSQAAAWHGPFVQSSNYYVPADHGYFPSAVEGTIAAPARQTPYFSGVEASDPNAFTCEPPVSQSASIPYGHTYYSPAAAAGHAAYAPAHQETSQGSCPMAYPAVPLQQQQHPYSVPPYVHAEPSNYYGPATPYPMRPAPQPPVQPTAVGTPHGLEGTAYPAATGFAPTAAAEDPNKAFLPRHPQTTVLGRGSGGGEERLEQLLAEIRHRLGSRAHAYDAALEESPQALMQLACQPQSLRRMQQSSLDWWYVLFRWQDRYHAMQLSGEIRRRNAAEAEASDSNKNDPMLVGEAVRRRSDGLPSTPFSFFSPRDETAFFDFLQKLQQAFAARSLTDEARAEGRLHDRMRCIRQLARAVSDDHRALGMGAAARKAADNLLWSLALQEARYAAADNDLLRRKGGVPMLLAILRLAETADRRRRRSPTLILVPSGQAAASPTSAANLGVFGERMRGDHLRGATEASESELASTAAASTKKYTAAGGASQIPREGEVVVQQFEGGKILKWEWVSADETQKVFNKLADLFLRCAHEANIEPCVHAVVGMGTLVEKSFLDESKWQKVCHAMTERLKLSEMVSAGSEAGLLLDSLSWMFVRNANASRRSRHVIFQVNYLLGQILRDTRSDVVARCVLGLALCRVFREENLSFYTGVLMKRQLRSDDIKKALTPRAFCNLLVANGVAGISAKDHLGVVVKYLLNLMATHDRAKNFALDESARFAWAICALRLYDTEEAGTRWSADEVAQLLERLLERIGYLVDGPQAAFIFEVLRDCHDYVAPLYPDMRYARRYAEEELQAKVRSAYDQSHLGLVGSLVTVVRGALKSFGGTVKPSSQRRQLLTRLREASAGSNSVHVVGESVDAAAAESSASLSAPLSGQSTMEPAVEKQRNTVADEVTATAGHTPEHCDGDTKSVDSSPTVATTTGANIAHKGDDVGEGEKTLLFAEDIEFQESAKSGESVAMEEKQLTVQTGIFSKHANTADEGGTFDDSEESAAVKPSPTPETPLAAEWIEGAVLDGYPVAFFSPQLKIALDIDVCSKLPSKYMKRRHLERYMRENGIRHLVFSPDLKQPQEYLYSFLERVLRDETDTLGTVGFRPVDLRAYLRLHPNRANDSSHRAAYVGPQRESIVMNT